MDGGRGTGIRQGGAELLFTPVGDHPGRGPNSTRHRRRPFCFRSGQRAGTLASFLAGENAARIVQPALVGDGDVLIGTACIGTRRISVRRDGEIWSTEEKWTNRKIRLYFNDFVVVNGYLYGFDVGKLVCVSLEDGSEAWRARGYGNGQVLLLADQGLLLVLSEDGNVALVSAQPEKHEELCRFKAIEGKTWNHPVIAHGKLFVRNGEEIACFDIGEIVK